MAARKKGQIGRWKTLRYAEAATAVSKMKLSLDELVVEGPHNRTLHAWYTVAQMGLENLSAELHQLASEKGRKKRAPMIVCSTCGRILIQPDPIRLLRLDDKPRAETWAKPLEDGQRNSDASAPIEYVECPRCRSGSRFKLEPSEAGKS